jgi:exodeoxyribonuclease VII large subunit
MKVTVHGAVSLYPQGGTVQLYVNSMAPDGLGALYKAYEQLKTKLADEGLFDEEHKSPIPAYPTRIGVITSPTGAAVRDIINVTGRRYPLAQIYLYPSLVQGDGAEADLVRAIDYFEASKLVDVIIIGRGGGSIEDLWAFNSELLARRIYSAKTPVISAVGHETDFTICDFVSDLRAPTPSAAAEIAVPDIRDIILSLDNASDRLVHALRTVAERKRERLERISDKPMFKDPYLFVSDRRSDINVLAEKADQAISAVLRDKSNDLRLISGKIDVLSPLAVLSRGYSITEKDGKVVFGVKQISAGDQVSLRFSDGVADATINSKKLSRKETKHEK